MRLHSCCAPTNSSSSGISSKPTSQPHPPSSSLSRFVQCRRPLLPGSQVVFRFRCPHGSIYSASSLALRACDCITSSLVFASSCHFLTFYRHLSVSVHHLWLLAASSTIPHRQCTRLASNFSLFPQLASVRLLLARWLHLGLLLAMDIGCPSLTFFLSSTTQIQFSKNKGECRRVATPISVSSTALLSLLLYCINYSMISHVLFDMCSSSYPLAAHASTIHSTATSSPSSCVGRLSL